MNVFAYLRVSTSRQAEDGLSIEVQEQQLEAYANLHNLSVNRWLRDRGISGSIALGDRPMGKQLLEEVRSGDVVIAAKLDRMFRNARDALNTLEALKSKGVALHFIDLGGDVCNGIGKLVFTILSAVAEQERSRIRERISEAKKQMRDENRYQGGKIPFGYRVNSESQLVEDELQQRCIIFMRAKRKEGMAYRMISDLLRKELGVALSHSGIRKILIGERRTDDTDDQKAE
jgi:putative DNA-invertase from lambdoid prophage Rac